MIHVKASEWIQRIPEGRGQIDAGAKLLLLALWGHIDWSIEHDTESSSCFPRRQRLAEIMGTSAETTKSRLAKLAALGWIRRERGGWALAWARPWVVAYTNSPLI